SSLSRKSQNPCRETWVISTGKVSLPGIADLLLVSSDDRFSETRSQFRPKSSRVHRGPSYSLPRGLPRFCCSDGWVSTRKDELHPRHVRVGYARRIELGAAQLRHQPHSVRLGRQLARRVESPLEVVGADMASVGSLLIAERDMEAITAHRPPLDDAQAVMLQR